MSVDSIVRAGIGAITTVGIYTTTAKSIKHAVDKLEGKPKKRKSKRK